MAQVQCPNCGGYRITENVESITKTNVVTRPVSASDNYPQVALSFLLRGFHLGGQASPCGQLRCLFMME
jgi:hypothetical protein